MKRRRYVASTILACLAMASLHLAEAEGARMNPGWIVVPGQSVGPLRLGMSEEEVRAAVGEPERTSFGPWEYLSGGFALCFNPARHTVNAILGGGAEGGLAKAFVARTAEGIGMGSTRAEIASALGEPELRRVYREGAEYLSYPGLAVMLDGDAVVHLTVWRAHLAPPPER